MKKKLLILFSLFSSVLLFSQVGINTENPRQLFHTDGKSSTATTNPSTGAPNAQQQADDVVITNQGRVGIGVIDPTQELDVNGRARIRVTDQMNSNEPYKVLVRDNSGIIKQLDGDIFTISEKKEITLTPGQTANIINNGSFETSNIIVRTTNACGRNMISSFQAYRGALVFLNGVGRDVIATASIVPIAPSENPYSPTWRIKFPNVNVCQNNGGPTQFDYEFYKANANTYVLKHLGDVQLTYRIIFQKI